ncbi:MAG TPA: TPM domain-containing protein, partial [Pseudobdellovibrionaceae bacterium]|nr:TPM domain-containing protein [Pseudobdellovibrionaceae bacterium]
WARAEDASGLEIPSMSGPVIDDAWVIEGKQKTQLETYLRNLNQRGIVQLQIWTIADLGAESIENAAIRAFDQWKLGDKGKDNGLLILLAPKNRKVRIEVGRGLEGVIPDAIAKRIIREQMTPHLRNRDYTSAILVAVGSLIKLADQEFASQNSQNDSMRAAQDQARGTYMGLGLQHLLIIFVVFIFFFLRFFFMGGGLGGGGWHSGGGGGGFGGGWSGGGGGSSGGGASGDW